MLMEHFLCDDVGGKRNVCEMEISFNLKASFKMSFSEIISNF